MAQNKIGKTRLFVVEGHLKNHIINTHFTILIENPRHGMISVILQSNEICV